jgi:hypothetical protein
VWRAIMLTRKISILSMFAGLALATLPAFSQEIPTEGPVPTTALINLEAKQGVTPDVTMLRLQVNRKDSPITTVSPVVPASAQVAILLDDGLRSSFANQVSDFAKFINQLPTGTKVLVGYMEQGTVRSAGGFSTNHEQVASQLRLPFSSPGLSASPYFCLSEFVKHWPSNEPGSRFVLMVTNGVDPYNGRPTIMNQNSPYVQTAQEDAERAGVAVYSIYYNNAGMRGGLISGQNYLAQVAEATGGQSFYQGTITPPSLGPYLDEFGKAIAESYSLNFLVSNAHEKKDTLTQIKVTTRQKGVKVHAPDSVRPGVVEQ